MTHAKCCDTQRQGSVVEVTDWLTLESAWLVIVKQSFVIVKQRGAWATRARLGISLFYDGLLKRWKSWLRMDCGPVLVQFL
jgi:hypothetical protein